MTAFTFLIVAISLLALLSGLGFVGCVLDTHGLGTGEDQTFTQYSGEDVIKNTSCVAFWPLSEPSATAGNPVATAIAKDAKGNNNGNYTHKGNAGQLFPCPDFTIVAGVDSAPAIGSLALGVNSLLPGDAVQPAGNPPVLTTGMTVEGGFVTVPFTKVVNPDIFSVEAWVRPEWTAGAKPAYRVIVDTRNAVGSVVSGYALWVKQDGSWEAQLGIGNNGAFTVTGGPAALSETAHVVLTFDGTTAALFVNGVQVSQATSNPPGLPFSPNASSPFVIGVGLPWLPARTQPTDNMFFPLTPWVGTIQNVAVYNAVLPDEDIKKHFDDGSGKTKVPAG